MVIIWLMIPQNESLRRHKTKPAKLLQALRVDSWFRLQRDEPGPWSEALLWTG